MFLKNDIEGLGDLWMVGCHSIDSPFKEQVENIREILDSQNDGLRRSQWRLVYKENSGKNLL